MKNKLISGMKSFFKNEGKDQESKPSLKVQSKQSKKLPVDFANQVLEYELQVDSGTCNL